MKIMNLWTLETWNWSLILLVQRGLPMMQGFIQERLCWREKGRGNWILPIPALCSLVLLLLQQHGLRLLPLEDALVMSVHYFPKYRTFCPVCFYPKQTRLFPVLVHLITIFLLGKFPFMVLNLALSKLTDVCFEPIGLGTLPLSVCEKNFLLGMIYKS